MKKTVVSVTIVFIAMAFTLNAMGENEYSNANNARAGANTEISELQCGTL